MSIPILYESGTTDFWNMGLGPLSDTLEATVTEQRNGEFYLDLSYPIDGERANELKNNRIIVADAGHSLKAQQFDITDVQRGLTKLTVHAEHVSYRTSRYPLTPTFKYTGNADGAIRTWQKAIVVDNNITADSDISTTGTVNLTIDKAQNARQVLGGIEGSILDVYGGEYRFDNEHISLLNHRGSVVNTLLAYGRNITDFNQEEAIGETYTSIYPYALVTKPGEDEVTLITLPEYYVDGDYVKNFPQRRVLPVDLSSKFGDKNPTTVDGLRTAAKAYVKANQVGVPKVSTTISFVDLSKTTDYADVAGLEEVNLCDEVPFWFSKYDIRTTAKVSSVVWNVLSDSYNSITLGDLAASLSESIQTIATQTASQEASKAIITVLQGADGLTNNFYSDGVSTSPTAKKIGDRWFAKNGDKTSLYIWDGVAWREVVSTDTADKIAADIDAKMEQLNADMSTADDDLQAAKQDVADLQVKLKANDEAQAQLKNDLSENSTILEKAQADIVTNAEDLTALDAKLKANDEAQAQLQNDLSANTKVQDQLKNDLAANSKLVTQNKEDVDAALDTVNKTLTQAKTDAETAVKNADQAVNNAQSAVEASGLATQTANAASDAALAAKNLATSTANDFATVQSQAATAANDSANALSNAKDAMGQANTAFNNASDALTKANSALATASSVQTSMQPAITTAVDKAKGELTASIQTISSNVDAISTSQGRNYVKNSRFEQGTLSWDLIGSGLKWDTSSAPQAKFLQPGLHMYADGTTLGQYNGIAQVINLKMIKGQPFVVGALQSYDGPYENGRLNVGVHFLDSDNNILDQKWTSFDADPNQNTAYRRQSTVFYAVDGTVSIRLMLYPTSTNLNVYVTEIYLKVGSAALGWSEAPEDAQQQITTNAMNITANSKEIALAAKQSVVDTLAKQVTDNTSQLKLTATSASLEVTSKKVDTLSQTVTDQGARLELTATSAQLKVTDDKVDDLNKTVSDNSAQLKLTATSAALETQSKRVDAISGKVDTNTAAITSANGEIELKASNLRVDTLSNTVSQQGIDIKAAQDQLALKLTASDLTEGLNGYATQTWASQQITASATGFETKLSTVQAQYNDISQSQGRNYVRNSRFESHMDNWSVTADASVLAIDTTYASQNNLGKPGLHIYGTTTADFQGIAQIIPLKMSKGQKFVIGMLQSFDGPASAGTLHIGVHYRDSTGAILSQEWHYLSCDAGWGNVYGRNSVVFTAADECSSVNLMIFAPGPNYNFNAYITEVSLTVGPTSFGWQAAPEDTATYTDAKIADFKVTVDGLSATFAKKTDLEKATSDFKVTSDGLNLITSVTGTKGENVTQVIADVKNIKTTMTGAGGYSTRLQTLEGFQQTVTGTLKDTATQSQITQLSNQIASVIDSGDNRVRKQWFDDGSIGGWNGTIYSTGSESITGHKNYLSLKGRDNLEVGNSFSVSAGETYYIDAWLNTWSAKYPVSIGLQVLMKDGSTKWRIAYTLAINKGPSHVSGSVTMPDLAQSAIPWVQIGGPAGSDLGTAYMLGMRVTQNAGSSQIAQLQDNIDLRVDVDNKVTAALSLSADGGGTVTIRGASLYVTAASHFDDASIKSASIASLDATKITSGSISSDRLATTKLNADNITSGSISADRLATTKLNASNITSGSINAGLITTGVLSADMIVGGTFDASKMTVKNINAGSITSGSIATALLASTKINADNITSGSIAAARIATTALSATNIVSGTLDVGKLTVKNLSADLIASGTIDASLLSTTKLNATNITAGTLDLGNLTVKNLKASLVVGGIFDASTMNVINLNGNSITAGTITADKMATNALLVGLNDSLSQVNITPTSIEIARSDVNLTSISLNSSDGILFSKGSNDIAGMHAGYTGTGLTGQLVLDTYIKPAADGQRWGRMISDTSSRIWMSYFWDEAIANKQGQPNGLEIDTNVIFRGDLYSRSATTSNDPHLHLSTMTQASGTHGIALLNDNNTGIEIDNDNNIYWVRNNVRTKVSF